MVTVLIFVSSFAAELIQTQGSQGTNNVILILIGAMIVAVEKQ
jgi:hypothetical protein